MKKTVAIGIYGSVLDFSSRRPARWEKWRPTLCLCQQEDLLIDRLVLIHQKEITDTLTTFLSDVKNVSPETETVLYPVTFKDPWDFEEVFGVLHDFSANYPFDPEAEDYLIHITTGTHVAQICLFLLTESRHLPGRLIQTQPPSRSDSGPGRYNIIDLDLSRYDRIAARFMAEAQDDISFLKSGIETRNPAFNALIAKIEKVALLSRDPVLLTGPTGSGKSRMAKKIFELKKNRGRIKRDFVELNCATLQGSAAMSALFGHKKGSFTGALQDREGLLRKADGGILFLDEIGELGLDEQAMLLRAIEEKRFLPLGADQEAESSFELICGTNRDLGGAVKNGRFREDLLARINLWTFRLPGLSERREDISPNVEYELDRFTRKTGIRTTMSREARGRFLSFAESSEALWPGNFRDLNAAVTRMATLAPGGRITVSETDEEIGLLRQMWGKPDAEKGDDAVSKILGNDAASMIDRFERVQLADVLEVCRNSRNASEAGRELFSVSRQSKKTVNDADRLRKYLGKFGLTWERMRAFF